MRKLLNLLSVLTVGSVTTTNAVACNNLNPIDQSTFPFLYHIAQHTNLGQISGDQKSILNALKTKNPDVNTDGLTVTDIDTTSKATSSANINVNEYNKHYKKGTLKVTFNISKSTDLQNLITTTNIHTNRNIDFLRSKAVPNVTEKDVIDGINASNGGLNLDANDVTVTFGKTTHTGGPIYQDKTFNIATIEGKGKYQGKITVNLNTDIDLSKNFSNTNIGKIFLPQAILDNWTNQEDYSLIIKAFLMEYVGDANPLFANYQDVIANLQFTSSSTALTFSRTSFTLNANYGADNPLSEYFTNSVTYNFEIKKENRLTITDAIKTTDLGNLPDNKIDTIKNAIIVKNKSQLKQFQDSEIKRYLIVNFDNNGKNTAIISWLPGSKQFLGHDPIALSVAPIAVKNEVGPITTSVNFNII